MGCWSRRALVHCNVQQLSPHSHAVPIIHKHARTHAPGTPISCRHVRFSPLVIEHYLYEFVFPEVMRFQGLKISACGQELGGEMLFDQRLCFSGTPSSLIPVELGKCHYEKGSDGKMLHLLTSPDVVDYCHLPDDWSVEGVLDKIAASAEYTCLIDIGALITGMNNEQVARYLIEHGLPHMDGCIFLDELDRKMILVRDGMRVIKNEQSGIPMNKRFSFYDQIHTTGMDIKQVSEPCALRSERTSKQQRCNCCLMETRVRWRRAP